MSVAGTAAERADYYFGEGRGGDWGYYVGKDCGVQLLRQRRADCSRRRSLCTMQGRWWIQRPGAGDSSR